MPIKFLLLEGGGFWAFLEGGWKCQSYLDASFLLTVEIFLPTVRLFYLRWGKRKQKRPKPVSGRGEP